MSRTRRYPERQFLSHFLFAWGEITRLTGSYLSTCYMAGKYGEYIVWTVVLLVLPRGSEAE
jgi:hypothetical protein